MCEWLTWKLLWLLRHTRLIPPLLHQSGMSMLTSSYDDEAKQATIGLANSGNTLQFSAGSTDARDAANQADRLRPELLLPLLGGLLYDH